MKQAAAAKKTKEVTEEELREKRDITPEDVLGLSKPCVGLFSHLTKKKFNLPGYLCKTTANVYGIDFLAFKLRDLDNNTTLFEARAGCDQSTL